MIVYRFKKPFFVSIASLRTLSPPKVSVPNVLYAHFIWRIRSIARDGKERERRGGNVTSREGETLDMRK